MHIRCPHCHNPIELTEESPPALVQCPSCGSRWKPADIGTETIRDTKVKTVGRFQLLELLGTGHFGEVWSANDPTLDRQVAIKLPRKEDLDEDDIERFVREARAAAQLKHPNIVGVHEVGKEGDLLYIVSDLIRGVSLSDWINAKRLLSFEETAKLCATLADALHYAHESGVIHRDLKPGNVLLDEHGEPHLTDFGLAKRESGEITMTIEGRVLGTPAYMSPEQARGDGHHADRRSDVYSLGVMLFELLTGQRPFQGNSRLLLHQVLHEEPRRPRKLNPKIPKDLQTICLKSMEKAPEKRYASAKDMADDLRRYLTGQPLVAQPIGRLERMRRWTRRNPVVASFLAAVAVLCVVIIAVVSDNLHQRKVAAPVLRTVHLTTKPDGARVVFHPLNLFTGELDTDRTVRPKLASPVTVQLEPGEYLVVAVLPDDRFHEVYRKVPGPSAGLSGAFRHNKWREVANGSVELPEIEIPSLDVVQGMADFAGHRDLQIGAPELPESPPQTRHISAFYLDSHEVTLGEYRQQFPKLPLRAEQLPPSDDHPMHNAMWDWAVSYAEKVGKRLPDEFEFEFAATNGGTRKFPWGDDPALLEEWKFDPVGVQALDKLDTNPPVFGLHSGVAEWTWSMFTPYPQHRANKLLQFSLDERVIRGGTPSVIFGNPTRNEWSRGPRTRVGMPRQTMQLGLGFRCARSAKPRR